VSNEQATPSEVTDEELLRLHLSGQQGAFESLVRRRGPEVFRFLVRFTGNRALADDVFQETFLQVHLAADRFDLSRRFKPWLFTIAANKARDAMRSRSRRRAAPLDARMGHDSDESTTYVDLLEANIQLPIEDLQNQELREAVQKVVLQMPQHLREVLLLSYFQQLPYKEVADVLSVPLGTVKSRLHAAVKHFAQRWESIGKRFANDD
jgi:RNA polymerase sigma-70 factor (ECF subfamily)